MERPTVIRLVTYVRVPRDAHRRKITRKAVLARDSWTCQYCGIAQARADRRPRDPAQPRRQVGLGEHRRLLRHLQPAQGQPPSARDLDAPAQPAGARRGRRSSSASPARRSRSPGSSTSPGRLEPGRLGRVTRAGPKATAARRRSLARCGRSRHRDSRPGGTSRLPASGPGGFAGRRCPGAIPPTCCGPHRQARPSGPAPPASRKACDSS